jgi:flagellar motor switch protein FliN
MAEDSVTAAAAEAAADDWAAAIAEQQASASTIAPPTINATNTTNANAVAENQQPHVFQRITKTGLQSAESASDIDLILDIPVQLTVELGRTRIPIKHILQLAQGSVIELDALAGEPMDVLVNGCLIAQGEVVVVNEKFGIRLTDIVTPSERMRRLNR